MTARTEAAPLFTATDENQSPASRALRSVYEQMPLAGLVYALLAAIMLVIPTDEASQKSLLVWVALAAGQAVLQWRVCQMFDRQQRLGSPRQWWQMHYGFSLLAGMHSAWLFVAFFPAEGSSNIPLLLVFLVASCSNSLALNTVSPLAFAASVLPAGFALAAQFALSDLSDGQVIAAALVVALGVSQRACHNMNRVIRNHLLLARSGQQGSAHTAKLVTPVELSRRASTLASHPGLLGQGVAILVVELNRINELRELRGTDTIDRMLNLVSLSLRQSLRAADTLARSEKDGFVVLLSPCSPAVSKVVADKLLDAIRRMDEYTTAENERLTASIGISYSESGRFKPAELLQLAVRNVRKASQTGANSRNFASLDDPR